MAELEQPIIIKKITKVEGGHHGGAWKVAYADFVTAMMAFFLLLWLLSSASEAQLSGISDYFSPTMGLQGEMGIGFEGGQTDQVEGTKRNNKSKPSIVTGALPAGVQPGQPTKKAPVDSPEGEDMLFEKGAAAINQMFAKSEALSELSNNIDLKSTPEGLKIQISDTERDPMFHPGHNQLTEAGERMLKGITSVVQNMPNLISIAGHTDTTGFEKREDYSNWELSAERANAARRYMERQGMRAERVAKVLGLADKELMYPMQPTHPKNRRIEITLMRGSHVNVPASDHPVRGVLPIQDRRDDIIRFEDERATRALESLEEKEEAPLDAQAEE